MSSDPIEAAGLANLALFEEMYERFQENPGGVPQSWRTLLQQFDGSPPEPPPILIQEASPPPAPPPQPLPPAATLETRALNVFNLIQAYRTYGHLCAKTNPIATDQVNMVPELAIERFGFGEGDLDLEFPTWGVLNKKQASLRDIISGLRDTYCGNIGVEYMGLQKPDLEEWLQNQIEHARFKTDLSIDQKRMILQHLNKSELLEVFLHTKYTGQKRFSLEGGETLIPVLATILEHGSELAIEDFIIGMAHRGRLNVLTNILNKSYSTIFSEFQEGYIPESFEGSGDVKYHKGFSSKLVTALGKHVQVEVTANPSHLEAVNPLVEGQVRAKQILKNDERKQEKVVPILIHGDAAIAGQGIIYETLQLYRLHGYSTGGTIHVIVNNQIGFTTLPRDARSTHYCTDIARSFASPVFHVNAEDPEGCVHATNLAVEIRQRFHCDVFIELNCYRKYGHNETDEPAFTQPLEYQLIRKKKPIREGYRDALIQQGILERQMAEALEEEFKAALQKALQSIKEAPKEVIPPKADFETKPSHDDRPLFQKVETAVPEEHLREMARKFCSIPKDLNINRKLKKIIDDRLKMVQGNSKEKTIDWGMGEHLAFASLLWEGKHVRLSGQDSRRGTFSHRHSMWVDQQNARKYFPLSRLKPDQGRFDVFNSPLSEYAVLGFDVGYSLANPKALVLWEAQFGDFCNGAQIIIDQFIASSEQKWGKASGITLLLPHGYEGQGPEHSSARMERFLQLCGDNNLQVAYPSTPAQLFHLLRRQALREIIKPLVVLTPKRLLRHPKCVSALDDFTHSAFEEFLDDPAPADKTQRLILCTGNVFYDLLEEREQRGYQGVTLVRMEQLYPVHTEKMQEILHKYKGFKQCLWVQEEPRNMGAWHFLLPWFQRYLPKGVDVQYVGRPRSAAPAAGSFAVHKRQHATLLNDAFRGLEKL